MLIPDIYGPQYDRDDAFTARMRFHQSWWRAERLGEPPGTDRNGTEYGSYLTADAAEAGKNFLTPAIADYALERIAVGGGVEAFRCTRNLLSSQPMAFNLFGPLHLDADLAAGLLDPLLPHGATAVTVDVEWAPDRHTHLQDATSFDVVAHYVTATGQPAIAAIETKLTESFSKKKYDTPRYREVAAKSTVWADPTSPELALTTWNQIWRNHLLVEAIRQQPDADPNLLGHAIVVHHPDDQRARNATSAYREFLATPDESFLVWTLESDWDPRRLLTLEARMESWDQRVVSGVGRRSTPRSCVSARCGWCSRFASSRARSTV